MNDNLLTISKHALYTIARKVCKYTNTQRKWHTTNPFSPSGFQEIWVWKHSQVWIEDWNFLPEIHDPLKLPALNLGSKIWLIWNRSPLTLGSSSGGVKTITETATDAKIRTITNRAMMIPFQFLWLGLAATNSCWSKKQN